MPGRKLDSWKEIASYLGRDQRTVQRWEITEDLPVHRHQHAKKSTVYAYTGELDEWFRKRQPKDDPEADAAFVPEPESAEANGEQELENVAPVAASKEATVLPPPAAETRTASGGNIKFPWPLATALLIALSLGAYLVYRAVDPAKSGEGKIRMVVMPFANLSHDPKVDYVSAGITEDITTQLGRLDPSHLAVIAPTSAARVSGERVPQIRQKLDVKYILEGSVQNIGSQIRIDVRLVEASDATSTWAQSFTRELSDLLQVESEVSDAVARQMVKSLPASSAPAPAAIPAGGTAADIKDARDAYLRGMHAWASRHDPQSGINFFERAIQLDPSYAQAYVGLAQATTVYGQVPVDGMLPIQAKPMARDAAKRALELNPRLAEAHAVLGNVAMSYDWDLAAAEKELKLAINLNPNDPTSHQWFSYVLMLEGRTEEALAESYRVLELDPATPVFHAVRLEVLCYARKYDDVIKEALSAIEVNPRFEYSYYWLGYAYREKKMYPEAIATFTKARQETADLPFLIMAYGHAQALAGNKAEAGKALHTLEQLQQTRFIPSLYPAAIHVGLGEKDEAFRLLNKALEERIDRLIYLKVEPMADPLRSDPRFDQLLGKIGVH